MDFKLVEAVQKSWRRLDGNNQLSKLILRVKFADGLEVAAKLAGRQPATPPPDRSGRHQKSAIAVPCDTPSRPRDVGRTGLAGLGLRRALPVPLRRFR
jgi:hypothetical protein